MLSSYLSVQLGSEAGEGCPAEGCWPWPEPLQCPEVQLWAQTWGHLADGHPRNTLQAPPEPASPATVQRAESQHKFQRGFKLLAILYYSYIMFEGPSVHEGCSNAIFVSANKGTLDTKE